MIFSEAAEDALRILRLVGITYNPARVVGFSKVLVDDQVAGGMVGDGCGGNAAKWRRSRCSAAGFLLLERRFPHHSSGQYELYSSLFAAEFWSQFCLCVRLVIAPLNTLVRGPVFGPKLRR